MLLEVNNLTVYYGKIKAIEDVSFHIDHNEIVTLIGPNGAGKSTCLKAVSGMLDAFGGRIVKGEIFLEDRSLNNIRTNELANFGVALVPEGRRIFPSMTVRENLEMGAFIRRDRKASIDEDIDHILALFPQLKTRINRQAGVLSGGEQQMLAVGRALMLKPKLILADEPSLGLSPNYIDLLFEKLVEINLSGISILLVEQNAQMALELCHRAYVFEVGSIALEGSKEKVVSNERVRQVYLGG